MTVVLKNYFSTKIGRRRLQGHSELLEQTEPE